MFEGERSAVVQAGYLRWSLRGNPFSFLSSEGAPEVAALHVKTEFDERLLKVIRDSLSGNGKKLIILIGRFGMGKTQKLRYVSESLADAERIYVKIDSDDALESAEKILRAFGRPRFPLFGKGHREGGSRGIKILARRVAEAANKIPRLLLMLDEIENVVVSGTKRDSTAFVTFLGEVHSSLRDGKVILISCVPAAVPRLGSLIQRAEVMRVPEITDELAVEIIRKRLRNYRIKAENGDNLAPFTEKLIKEMNKMARGNPRRLLRLARMVLAHLAVEQSRTVPTEDDLLRLIGGTRELAKGSLPDELASLASRSNGVSIIEASRALGTTITEARRILEEYVNRGLLEKGRGRYHLPR